MSTYCSVCNLNRQPISERLGLKNNLLIFFQPTQQIHILVAWPNQTKPGVPHHWGVKSKGFYPAALNTLRPRQNGRHFADDTFKCIFLNGNVWIPIPIWLGFVPKGPINNIPTLVQIMAWRRSGDKPLSEPMMVSLLTHICVTRPQWVKGSGVLSYPERAGGRADKPC